MQTEKLRHPNPNYPDRELAPEDRHRADADLVDRLHAADRKARDGDITYDALAGLCAEAADALTEARAALAVEKEITANLTWAVEIGNRELEHARRLHNAQFNSSTTRPADR